MADPLLATLADGALSLTLNRPEKRNALNTPMLEALHAAFERAGLDQAVRVVVLRGAGRDFCAGADLAELLASVEQDADANERDAMHLGDLFLRMRSLPKPVVALVHGRALAGGCGLATACDLVLAHEGAEFGYPEVRRGFVPAMVMAMLRRVAGEKQAFDLVATGRLLSAAEARELGLASRVIAAATWDVDAGAVIAGLAGASPTALALIKRQFYALDTLPFEAGVRMGARVNAVARGTPDFASAVRAFLEH